MCLAGNEIEIMTALQALHNARATREAAQSWRDRIDEGFTVTADEARMILDDRIAKLEARCRELGCHGPAAKANSADQVRIAAQR